jgi:hypothetical protein
MTLGDERAVSAGCPSRRGARDLRRFPCPAPGRASPCGRPSKDNESLQMPRRNECVLPPRLRRSYPCAWRYAVITDAGTRPRPLTASPLWRAQERMSALLAAAPAPAAALADLRELALETRARRRGWSPGDRWSGVERRVGWSASRPSSETTRVTPYREPTTRIASSSGSSESTVSLTAFPSSDPSLTHGTGQPFVRYKQRHPHPQELTETKVAARSPEYSHSSAEVRTDLCSHKSGPTALWQHWPCEGRVAVLRRVPQLGGSAHPSARGFVRHWEGRGPDCPRVGLRP